MHNLRHEKLANKLAAERPELEAQLRSERAKLGATTKAVRAAEKGGISPDVTGATAAQSAARAVVAETSRELARLTEEFTASRVKADMYARAVHAASTATRKTTK